MHDTLSYALLACRLLYCDLITFTRSRRLSRVSYSLNMHVGILQLTGSWKLRYHASKTLKRSPYKDTKYVWVKLSGCRLN